MVVISSVNQASTAAREQGGGGFAGAAAAGPGFGSTEPRWGVLLQAVVQSPGVRDQMTNRATMYQIANSLGISSSRSMRLREVVRLPGQVRFVSGGCAVQKAKALGLTRRPAPRPARTEGEPGNGAANDAGDIATGL